MMQKSKHVTVSKVYAKSKLKPSLTSTLANSTFSILIVLFLTKLRFCYYNYANLNKFSQITTNFLNLNPLKIQRTKVNNLF